jgi:deazaflavin-dependent oxidoreductase (nitroreductase family)
MMNGRADQFLYLTTTGRKTGLPREIEISFVELDAGLYILAEHGHKAQWVRNILANPRVHVRIGDQQWQGTARVLDPKNDADTYLTVRELSRQKCGWGDGLPVEIRLDP